MNPGRFFSSQDLTKNISIPMELTIEAIVINGVQK
jgi:hypothetical protein